MTILAYLARSKNNSLCSSGRIISSGRLRASRVHKEASKSPSKQLSPAKIPIRGKSKNRSWSPSRWQAMTH